jgi:peptidyl-prolyl cis-trans isomerase D
MVITWLQNTTQRHHRLIFGFLLLVVAVSFIFYTGTSPSQPTFRGETKYLGVDLGNRRAVERFDDALRLSGFRADGERRTYELCLAIARRHLADALEIPSPSAEAVQTRVRELLTRGAGGAIDPRQWEAFVSGLQVELGCDRAEALARLESVIEDQLRWETASELLSGPGHASPAEVRRALEEMGTRWTVQVARLDAEAFNPGFADDLAKAKAHFAANVERHRIPASLKVRAATFPASAPRKRTVTEEEIQSHAYNFARELGIAEGKVPEEAARRKDEITARILAREGVQEDCANLSDLLAQRFPLVDQAPAVADLEAWIGQQRGVTRDLPAFSAGEEPSVPGVPASALRAAAAMAESVGWHTEFYPTAAGAVFLVVTERTPSRLPAFEEVQSAALADWRASERGRLLLLRAKEAGDALAKAVAGGKAFADAAREAGLGLDPAPAPFPATEIPESIRGTTVSTLSALTEAGEGKVTEGIRVAGGDFAYLLPTKREVTPVDPSSEAFRNAMANVARQNARTTLYGNPGFTLPNGQTIGGGGVGLLDELTSQPEVAPSLER